MPGFTAPKLVWVKRHEPEIFAKVKTVLLPKDYVRLRLTGDKASEMSDSAGTLWLDTAKRDWSDEMLALTDLSEANMPKLFEGSEATGTLRPELARRWGMTGKVVVAGGGGDNAASACGVGAVAPGHRLHLDRHLGRALRHRRPLSRQPGGRGPRLLPRRAATPGTRWASSSPRPASLDWLAHILQAAAGDLVGALGDKPTGPSSIIFLPYLSGERTPHNDVAIRGVFAGLDQAHRPQGPDPGGARRRRLRLPGLPATC